MKVCDCMTLWLIWLYELYDTCKLFVWYETNTHYTLIHIYIHCNTLQHTATLCNTLQHTATHCNTLQHTATHCNTLQHTATHTLIHITGWRRPTGCLILIGLFPQKSPIISDSFAERDLHLKAFCASSPLCMEDAYILVAKEPLIVGLFCRKWPLFRKRADTCYFQYRVFCSSLSLRVSCWI